MFFHHIGICSGPSYKSYLFSKISFLCKSATFTYSSFNLVVFPLSSIGVSIALLKPSNSFFYSSNIVSFVLRSIWLMLFSISMHFVIDPCSSICRTTLTFICFLSISLVSYPDSIINIATSVQEFTLAVSMTIFPLTYVFGSI